MLKFKWHEEVQLVRGYTRSLIYDLNRRKHQFISNEVYDLIKEFEGKGKDIIESKLDIDLKNWFDDFYEKEYYFYTPENLFHNFTKLSLEWDYPSLISNLIVDIPDATKQLEFSIDDTGCRHIALRFIGTNITPEDIKGFLERNIENTITQSVDIHLKEGLDEDLLKKMLDRFPFINNWIIPNVKNQSTLDEIKFDNILYPKTSTSDKTTPAFIIDIGLFTESQKHHPYFNRKLYIGENGGIKNAPECEENFGYIQDINNTEELNNLISKPEFQKNWNTNKDSCDVCKDCEFRYMCIENRLPKNRTDGSWYHTIECAYNPYICKWEGEEEYKTLNECGIISENAGYKINRDKVDSINKYIWTE